LPTKNRRHFFAADVLVCIVFRAAVTVSALALLFIYSNLFYDVGVTQTTAGNVLLVLFIFQIKIPPISSFTVFLISLFLFISTDLEYTIK